MRPSRVKGERSR